MGLEELFKLGFLLHQLYEFHGGCELFDRVLLLIVNLVEVDYIFLEKKVVIDNLCSQLNIMSLCDTAEEQKDGLPRFKHLLCLFFKNSDLTS